MATGDIQDLEYVILNTAGSFAGFAGAGGSPSQIITASLTLGTYILRLTNAPDLGQGGTWPPNYPGCWVYCIGSSISLIRLDASGNAIPNGGSYLCMDRNNIVYSFDFDAYPPFRTTNLGQIYENCTPQYHPITGGNPFIQFSVTSPTQKVQIRCDVLMEDDVTIISGGPFGGGLHLAQGPYGSGRWAKAYEGAVLAKRSSDTTNTKQKSLDVSTTYLVQNPGVVLQSVG